MRRGARAAMVIAGALLVPAGTAAAQSQPVAPWDGVNPFVCQLQYVGTGKASDAPDPNADPFCIEYDKTQQNVTDFGIADFLAQEPDRVEGAADKCFYFQSDHWTGSIQQGQDPELWHWDGHYFFDKAKGIGGAFVKNFRVGGQGGDPRQFAPPEFHPYMNESGGGVITTLESGPDPDCVARTDTEEERAKVYRDSANAAQTCAPPGGELEGRRIGWARLGKSRERVVGRFGPPDHREEGVERYCLEGRAEMRLHYIRYASVASSPARPPRRIAGALSTSLGHRYRGVGRGTRLKTARDRVEMEQEFRFGGTRVFEGPTANGRHIFFGVRKRKVRWVAITDEALGEAATERFLRNANLARD